jgi:hypothetical protein
MHPSLLAQYVGASSYPTEGDEQVAFEKLKPLVNEFGNRSKFVIARIEVNGKHAIAAISLELLPEPIEEQIDTILSLPPGEREDLHSNVVGTLVQYQMWRRSLFEQIASGVFGGTE